MIPIPTPIILPASNGPDPSARDLAFASIVLGAGAAGLLALREAVYARTTDFACSHDRWDPIRKGVDCTYRSLNDNAYDAIHSLSGLIAWMLFGLAAAIGLLAGPFLARPPRTSTTVLRAALMYVLLGALIQWVPTPGPEFLDPIRAALLASLGLSLAAFVLVGALTKPAVEEHHEETKR